MPAQESPAVNERREPEKVLVSWTAPARPFKRRDREFYVTVIAIAGVVGLILFLIDGFLPVALIAALVFLFYVMSTVEPEKIEYAITTKGVKVGAMTTPWELVTRFWISRRYDTKLLVFEITPLPGRMELVLEEEKKEMIKNALLDYIPQEKVPPSTLDRAANWFAKKLPQ